MSRKPDEIMAEYLLTGNKMLSETCKTCGAPLFEVKGKKYCVVCAEMETEAKTAASAQKSTPAPENIRVIVPEYAKEAAAGSAAAEPTELGATLDALIAEFCRRAAAETDAGVCLKLMECVRTAAEAKMMLNRK